MRSEITTRISLSGGDEVKRALQELGAAGEKALADLSRSSGKAGKDLGEVSAASGDLHSILLRLSETTGAGGFGGGIFSTLSTAAEGFNTVIGATVGIVAGVVTAFAALAVAGAHAAAEIKEGSERVGVSAEDYTKLKFAFEQTGSSGEVFEKAMAKILDASNKAAEAAKKTALEVVKANEAIEASAKKAAEGQRATAIKNYEELRSLAVRHYETMQAARFHLNESLEKIDQAESDARAANAGRDFATDQAIAKKFDAERAALRKEAAEKQAEANRKAADEAAEMLRKQALAEAEAARKRQQERQAELDKYNKMITDAAEQAGNAFEQVGVKLLNAAGAARDPANVFRDIAEVIGKIADPAEKSAKVIELFTRRIGVGMVDALAQGRVGLEDLAKEAEHLGLVFTDADIKIGKQFNDTILKLGNTISATASKIGLAFAPLFDTIGEALAKAFGGAQGPMVAAAKAVAEAVKPIFDDLAHVIEGDFDKVNSTFISFMIPIVKLVGQAFLDLGRAIGTAFTIMKQSLDEIAGLMNDVFGTKASGGDIAAFGIAIYAAVKAIAALRTAFISLNIAAAPWLLLVGAIAAAVALCVLPLDKMKDAVREVFGQQAADLFESFVRGFRAGVAHVADGLGLLVGTLQGIKEIFINTWQLIVDTVTEKSGILRGIIQGIIDIFVNWYTLVKDGWTAVGEWIIDHWKMAFDTIINGVNTIIDWFAGAWKSIKDGFTSVTDWISKKIDDILGFFRNLITKAGEVAAAVAGAMGGATAGAAGGGMVIAAAMGGLIMGAGTGTSDSIHAMVSHGEYINRAASVEYYGPRIFDALNRMAIPRAAIVGAIKPAGFSGGGPITSLPPPTVRFAGGGEVIAGGPVGHMAITLTHAGKTFPGLLAPRIIADALEGHATEQATLSAGKPPGWTNGRG